MILTGIALASSAIAETDQYCGYLAQQILNAKQAFAADAQQLQLSLSQSRECDAIEVYGDRFSCTQFFEPSCHVTLESRVLLRKDSTYDYEIRLSEPKVASYNFTDIKTVESNEKILRLTMNDGQVIPYTFFHVQDALNTKNTLERLITNYTIIKEK